MYSVQKAKQIIKYFIAVFIALVLFVCIWGIPLKETRADVKALGTNVNGTFTGTWSPVWGKKGMFTADEGWIFEGQINPDGGLWKGQLVNFPIPSDWRTNSMFDFPEFYTGAVEDNTLTDVSQK